MASQHLQAQKQRILYTVKEEFFNNKKIIKRRCKKSQVLVQICEIGHENIWMLVFVSGYLHLYINLYIFKLQSIS